LEFWPLSKEAVGLADSGGTRALVGILLSRTWTPASHRGATF